MLVFDFSVGAGGPTEAFRQAGDTVIEFDINVKFEHPDTQEFMALEAEDLIARYGQPDFIWASPPCVTFSVASMGHHWTGGKGAYVPKTQAAVDNTKIVEKIKSLAEELAPTYGFIIENPRGVLRKLPVLRDLELRTVTYCSYGDDRMKPTDLWGTIDGWYPQLPCYPGAPCHEAAPRGSKTGTNSRKTAALRAAIPIALPTEIRNAITKSGTSIHNFLQETK